MPCSERRIEVVNPHPPPPTTSTGTVMSDMVCAPGKSGEGVRTVGGGEAVPHLADAFGAADEFVVETDEPLGIAGEADPRGGAGEDEVAGAQRQNRGQVGHEDRDREDQV